MKKIAMIIIGIGLLILVGVLIALHVNHGTATATNRNETVAQTTSSHTGKHSKVLVVYLSRTGHTKQVAETIHRQVGGDFYRLETQETYPKKYQQMLKVAQSEQDANARPKLKGQLPDLTNYQTIFLGYPIWWNKNPMAINTFLSHYSNLKGKTIYPFTTSGSSGLGSSVAELRQNDTGAKFGKGLPITDSEMDQAPSMVKSWLKGLQF